jgi:hypothetical protein
MSMEKNPPRKSAAVGMELSSPPVFEGLNLIAQEILKNM